MKTFRNQRGISIPEFLIATFVTGLLISGMTKWGMSLFETYQVVRSSSEISKTVKLISWSFAEGKCVDDSLRGLRVEKEIQSERILATISRFNISGKPLIKKGDNNSYFIDELNLIQRSSVNEGMYASVMVDLEIKGRTSLKEGAHSFSYKVPFLIQSTFNNSYYVIDRCFRRFQVAEVCRYEGGKYNESSKKCEKDSGQLWTKSY